MIFIINNLKCDTDKMELVAEHLKIVINKLGYLLGVVSAEDCSLYRSINGRWLVVTSYNVGHIITENEVKNVLLDPLNCDECLKIYEHYFGELEEA